MRLERRSETLRRVDVLVALRDAGIPIKDLVHAYYLLQVGGIDLGYGFSVSTGQITARGSKAVMESAKSLGYLSTKGDVTLAGDSFLCNDVIVSYEELEKFEVVVNGCLRYKDCLYKLCLLDIVLMEYDTVISMFHHKKDIFESMENLCGGISEEIFNKWFVFLYRLRQGGR